jgi:eukaryotic-like serine/threonine-protein kinase
MPVLTHSDELLALLRKSRLLPEATLSQFLERQPLSSHPIEAARAFLAAKLITPFQAKLLLVGRYKGFRLGSYILLDQIGQGGMGTVYLGRHEGLEHLAALKVLPPGQKRAAVERFLQEAAHAATLDHPNIVKLLEAGEENGAHYIAMEYIVGQTLDKVLAEYGRLTVEGAAECIAQAAQGLQHAHERGLVHRDIKPGNLIITSDRVLKILDMGLALRTNGRGKGKTPESSEVIGTADYISPEQARNASDIDIRSDIYSLGATFYTLVSGKPPFEGHTAGKLLQHQMKDPRRLTELDRKFRPKISAVIAKMMAKKPAERYQTPVELIKALSPWLKNREPVGEQEGRLSEP